MQELDGQPHRVAVRELKLSNYRNYNHIALRFSDSHVVFTGHNGAGKTNLLEALSFLSLGRGLRRASFNEIVTQKSAQENSSLNNILHEADGFKSYGGFVVFTHLYSDLYGDVKIGSASDGLEGGRKLRIDGANKPIDSLNDYCRILWLTPAMDGLFTGSAGDRRRFLDRLVLSIDPSHAKRALDYEKLMRSRNRLLNEGNQDDQWFDAIECQMAQLATAIAAARLALIGFFENLAPDISNQEVFPTANLSLEGTLEQALLHHSALEVEEGYMRRLRDKRKIDRHAGRTLEGPHRSDLQVLYAKKNMPAAFCSTGEQKILLTGLILSHAKLTAQLTGLIPILLLDEIVAHLDVTRRVALFEILDKLGGQAFMTGTDHALFASMEGRAEFFEISNGRLL